MPFPLVPLAISLGSSLFGGLANRGGEDPSSTQLRQQLMKSQGQLLQDPDLSGYGASQTDLINRNSDLERKRLLELLAARGVSGPAVGFAEGNLERDRFSDITKLNQSLPLLARSLKSDAIATGTNLLNAGGKQPGNAIAGAGGNLLSTLAYLYGQGAFSPSGSNTPTQSIH